MIRRGFLLMLELVPFVFVSAAAYAAPPGWNVYQIAGNPVYPESQVEIDHGFLTWYAVSGGQTDVYLHDIAAKTTTNLTPNSPTNEGGGMIDQGRVVLVRTGGTDGGTDRELFLYDAGSKTTSQLTANDLDDDASMFAAGRIAGWVLDDYYQGFLSESEILLYSIAPSTRTQLTDNLVIEYPCDMDQDYLVWEGYPAGTTPGALPQMEIFLYEFATGSITRLTDNSVDDQGARVSNGYIVWRRGDLSAPGEIVLYDIAAGTTTSLTTTADGIAQIDHDYVAWSGYALGGADREVFVYDIAGHATTQITSNAFDDIAPFVDQGLVVWWGSDGSDYEVFHHRIASGVTTQLTDNSFNDVSVRISQGRVAWIRQMPSGDAMFVAVPVTNADGLISQVKAMPNSAFKKPADQRRAVLLAGLERVNRSIAAGHPAAALAQLASLRVIVGGFTPQVRENRWIVDKQAQEAFLGELDALVGYLTQQIFAAGHERASGGGTIQR